MEAKGAQRDKGLLSWALTKEWLLQQSGAAVRTKSQLDSDWEERVGRNQSSPGKTSLTVSVQCSGNQIAHGCNLSKCHQYPKTGKDLADISTEQAGFSHGIVEWLHCLL